MAQVPGSLRGKVRGLVAGELPWPLFVSGPPGTGKTCAALCLLDHAGGLYFTASGLADELLDAQKGRVETQGGRTLCGRALYAEIASCSLLVLDELGVRERVSDWAYEALKRAIDAREGRPLVCLSNLDLAALSKVYDDRLASRLAAGTVLELAGQDRRLRR